MSILLEELPTLENIHDLLLRNWGDAERIAQKTPVISRSRTVGFPIGRDGEKAVDSHQLWSSRSKMYDVQLE